MRRHKPYHHGNLREALLEAAIGLTAEVSAFRRPAQGAELRRLAADALWR